MKPKTEDELIELFLKTVKKMQEAGGSSEVMVISADDYERLQTENHELRQRLALLSELVTKERQGAMM